MAFTPDLIQRLKDRADIVAWISKRVVLKKRGAEYLGLCPFHGEKNPSFTVNSQKGFYHCFGCGAHGTVFDFLMQLERLSFPEAVEQVAESLGMPLEETQQSGAPQPEHQEALRALECAAQLFSAHLESPAGASTMTYLTQRGVDVAARAKFRLGLAPRGRQELVNILREQGFSNQTILLAGLAFQNDEGALIDRFTGRLMFPITNARGAVIAFGGRALGDMTPKYLNSPETPLFHKGSTLYNWHNARAMRSKPLVVAEGYMDVIALDAAGYAAVAPLGTALTEQQMGSAWRLSGEAILAFDGDTAGRRAAMRATERLLPLITPEHRMSVLLLPEGEDPDTLLKSAGGAQKFAQLVETRLPLMEFLWETGVQHHPTQTPEDKAVLEAHFARLAATIHNEALRRLYGSAFRERLYAFFSPKYGGALRERQNTQAAAQALKARRAPRQEALDIQQKILLVTLLLHPHILDDVLEELATCPFEGAEFDALRSAILEGWDVYAEVAQAADPAASPEKDGNFIKFLIDSAPELKEVIEQLVARPDWTLHAPHLGRSESSEEIIAKWRALAATYTHQQTIKQHVSEAKHRYADTPSPEDWVRYQQLKQAQHRPPEDV